MLEMVRMNGLFIPLQKGAWNLQEFRRKIPGYPGFLYMQKSQEKARKSQEWQGSGKAWKAKRIFSMLSRLFFMCKKAWKARSSDLFVDLWAFPVFFLEGARTVSFP